MSKYSNQKTEKMCHSKNNLLRNAKKVGGFTLLEVAMSIAILASIISGAMVVMNQCIIAIGDQELKMQAFEIARNNMETLLGATSIKDMTELGTSEKYPDIDWETTVESFYEPITSRMWTQAVCSATYTDSTNEEQEIELTHWLTNLSKTQMRQVIDQVKREQEYLKELEELRGKGPSGDETLEDGTSKDKNDDNKSETSDDPQEPDEGEDLSDDDDDEGLSNEDIKILKGMLEDDNYPQNFKDMIRNWFNL